MIQPPTVNMPQTSRMTRSVPSISEIVWTSEQHSNRVFSHQGESDHTSSHGSSESLEHVHTTTRQPSEGQKPPEKENNIENAGLASGAPPISQNTDETVDTSRPTRSRKKPDLYVAG